MLFPEVFSYYTSKNILRLQCHKKVYVLGPASVVKMDRSNMAHSVAEYWTQQLETCWIHVHACTKSQEKNGGGIVN